MSKKIKVTDSPKFSFETRPDGKVIARYSVGINGENYTTEYTHNSMGNALHGAKERYNNNLKQKFPELETVDIDSRLGAPKREHPSAWRQRMSENSQNEQQEAQTTSAQALTALNDSPGSQAQPQQASPSNLAQNQSENEREVKEHVKGRPRNHVPFTDDAILFGTDLQDGRNGKTLEEPVPDRMLRPGEKMISAATFGGTDNNASIVFGRDNNPSSKQVFSKDIEKSFLRSEYSDHMGAGAIDIVVGRMAPFPLSNLGSAAGEFKLGPCYKTYTNAKEIEGIELTNGVHPGHMMDAARIYLSQMTLVDEFFGFPGAESQDTLEIASSLKQKSVKVYPHSGIVLKADRVRVHARRDIKIMTGGQNEPIDSQGIPIQVAGGIHLMAKMGMSEQQPIPLGNNLEDAFESLLGLLQDIISVIDRITAAQLLFNMAVKDHFHALPITTTLPDPVNSIAGTITNLEELKAGRIDSFFQNINFFNFSKTFLNRTNKKYINSRLNTVN